jgi:hypothetical protein
MTIRYALVYGSLVLSACSSSSDPDQETGMKVGLVVDGVIDETRTIAASSTAA